MPPDPVNLNGRRHEKILDSAIDAIGNAPLMRLDRLICAHRASATLLAKPDYLNPGSSKKDRAARGIIEAAERDGSQCPDRPWSSWPSATCAPGSRSTAR
ncbi:cysteine synthase CysK [Burkholderia plantarii]|uniref:Cysteine synthase CysK n=1 Tax=Burkholderia plantarii TaxID=41899 RepID=A0A0B6S499_BURPL|nr:cysteine synthase CysK [Burkholderia plantarii]